ncbi:hypothetical protein RHMOL_Rhmol07G0083300 [Rhododendron molle]|uniref:Uncharacterized protein n=1 Tax=Rhododendron molle TaxID=49168 RepID=A0ACC0MZJ5_RHOML|nr:hypothetical protein RHMOL_Rhmol07G0083300 [Rhododendron molle]
MESTTATTRLFSPKSSSLIRNSFHSFLKPSKTHLPAIAHLHLKYFTNNPIPFKTPNTTRPGFSIVQTRATVEETDRVADSRLLVDQEEEQQPNKEVEECVKVLKNAAKTRQVAAKEGLSALSVMEKAKLDPSGFLETLGGRSKSPGRTWMLIFTAKSGSKSGGYIPITAVQRFDAAAKRIENGVFLGPLGCLTFEGRGKHRDREISRSRFLRDFSRLLRDFLLLRFTVSAIRGVIPAVFYFFSCESSSYELSDEFMVLFLSFLYAGACRGNTHTHRGRGISTRLGPDVAPLHPPIELGDGRKKGLGHCWYLKRITELHVFGPTMVWLFRKLRAKSENKEAMAGFWKRRSPFDRNSDHLHCWGEAGHLRGVVVSPREGYSIEEHQLCHIYLVSEILIDVESVLCGYLRCSLMVAVGARFRFFALSAAVHSTSVSVLPRPSFLHPKRRAYEGSYCNQFLQHKVAAENILKLQLYSAVTVFAHHFQSFFHDQIIAEIVFRMNNFEWKVPRQNGHLQPIGMEVLQNRLRLQDSDLVFIAVKDPSDIWLFVLSSYGSEQMYFWF